MIVHMMINKTNNKKLSTEAFNAFVNKKNNSKFSTEVLNSLKNLVTLVDRRNVFFDVINNYLYLAQLYNKSGDKICRYYFQEDVFEISMNLGDGRSASVICVSIARRDDEYSFECKGKNGISEYRYIFIKNGQMFFKRSTFSASNVNYFESCEMIFKINGTVIMTFGLSFGTGSNVKYVYCVEPLLKNKSLDSNESKNLQNDKGLSVPSEKIKENSITPLKTVKESSQIVTTNEEDIIASLEGIRESVVENTDVLFKPANSNNICERSSIVTDNNIDILSESEDDDSVDRLERRVTAGRFLKKMDDLSVIKSEAELKGPRVFDSNKWHFRKRFIPWSYEYIEKDNGRYYFKKIVDDNSESAKGNFHSTTSKGNKYVPRYSE